MLACIRLLFGLLLIVTSLACSSNTPLTSSNPQLNENQTIGPLTVGLEAIESQIQENLSLKVSVFLENAGDRDTTFLVWNTPFEKILSANLFSVRRDGVELPYIGRTVKRGEPLPEHYLTIPSGKRISATVDLALYYDVSVAGSYDIALNLPASNGITYLNGIAVVEVQKGAASLTAQAQ